MLDKWILELKPEEKKYCRSGGYNVKYTREQKEEAVISSHDILDKGRVFSSREFQLIF